MLGSEQSPSSTLTLLAVLGLSVALLANMMWPRKKRFNVHGKHCYIGGGSEGLGLALACQLARRGAHVTVVSRSETKLVKAVAQIKKHCQSPEQKIAHFACDLTSSSESIKTIRAACEPFASAAPDYVFACAGGALPGMFADMDVDEHWRAMEWNFKTALCTVHEGVRMMRETGTRGTVVLTASVLSMMGFAGYASYSPSKYAIRGLADSLRNELKLYGISVHLFLPATIFSPGFENEQKLKPAVTKKIEGPDEGMTPEQVATRMIRGLERNEYCITYEPVGHMLRNSRGIAPRNNLVMDTLWGIAGTVVWPLWRRFAADAEVKKERKRLQSQRRTDESGNQ